MAESPNQVCARFSVAPVPVRADQKVGIAKNVREGVLPIHGLRLLPVGDTCGWYIWSGGEMSKDPDFFQPLHVEHLGQWCPTVVPYLHLPPGWRILIAPDYEDVWYQESLVSGQYPKGI
jgi:hypothetical protein